MSNLDSAGMAVATTSGVALLAWDVASQVTTSGIDFSALIDRFGFPVIVAAALWFAYQKNLDGGTSAIRENTAATNKLTEAVKDLGTGNIDMKNDIRDAKTAIAEIKSGIADIHRANIARQLDLPRQP